MNLPKKELFLHSNMCIIGGYLGAYALLCRCANFGSAQTNNMIQIFCCILGKDYMDFFLRILGLFVYAAAIVLCVVLSKKTSCNMQKYAITIDFIGMILLCFIPASVNPIIGILPIFFIMATHWSVFHGVGKYNSSTIFSTNNLRQMTVGISEYLLTKEETSLNKAKFYGNTLLWYHIGVILSFFACREFGIYASLCCIPFTLSAFFLTSCKSLAHIRLFLFCHKKQ